VKTHFGFFEDYGDYESPCYGCEITVCGCTGENAIENTVDDWKEVTCKKCLKLKDAVIAGIKSDEEAIMHQMGEMANFFKEEELNKL
jgi:hypothetical protein